MKPDKDEINSLENELKIELPPVPINLAKEAIKSIFKINLSTFLVNKIVNGFFIKTEDSKKYIIVNYHIISQDIINKEIEIELYNHKKMKLNLNARQIKYFQKLNSITFIEIKDTDEIFNDIKFLYCDSNYKKGYENYKNRYIFSIKYPLEEKPSCISGQIININNYEFKHNLIIDNDSNGYPIMLLNNNIEKIQIIGIIFKVTEKLNDGIFIGEIFNEDKYKPKILVVRIIGIDSCVSSSIVCREDDIFSHLEEKFYLKYPEYRDRNIAFLANGNIINRSFTLAKNRIKNGDTILVYDIDG